MIIYGSKETAIMKKNDFYYLCVDPERNEVFTYGATFTQFYEFIPFKPQNLLLMKANFWGGQWNMNTRFEYVENQGLKDLLEDNVYNYGDFCWVDFDSKEKLDAITPTELSELLYLSHKFVPLNSPFFDRLNNTYTYLAHDDDYWTKIFLKDTHAYKKVLEGKILKVLKGRKRSIDPLPTEILDFIFDGAKEGILINFSNAWFSRGSSGIRIYRIGRKSNYDEIHEMYERKQNCLSNLLCLYNV